MGGCSQIGLRWQQARSAERRQGKEGWGCRGWNHDNVCLSPSSSREDKSANCILWLQKALRWLIEETEESQYILLMSRFHSLLSSLSHSLASFTINQPHSLPSNCSSQHPSILLSASTFSSVLKQLPLPREKEIWLPAGEFQMEQKALLFFVFREWKSVQFRGIINIKSVCLKYVSTVRSAICCQVGLIIENYLRGWKGVFIIEQALS